MKFNVVTIFPEMITDYCSKSILGRAQKKELINVNAIGLRPFAEDKHQTVDDTPYGGGAGMVMKPDPIYKALKSIDAIPFSKVNGLEKVKKIFTGKLVKKKRTVLLSPRGRQFTQRIAEEWSKYQEITFVCGRYEGIDQRVVDHMIDEEISVGPYVLAGGELGAMIIIEAVSRLLPGVLGNPESIVEETHGRKLGNSKNRKLGDSGTKELKKKADGIMDIADLEDAAEYPQYTKPVDFMGWKVPDVLLGGNHKKIEEWRKGKSERK